MTRSGSSSIGGGHLSHSKLRPMRGQATLVPPGFPAPIQARPEGRKSLRPRVKCILCFLMCLLWLIPDLAGVAAAAPTSVVMTTSVKSRIADLRMYLSAQPPPPPSELGFLRSGSSYMGGGHILHSKTRALPGQTSLG